MTTSFRAGDVLLDRKGTVSKILVVDEPGGAVHLRFYDGAFASKDAVLEALRAKKLEWSIGHAPMAIEALAADEHTVVTNETVAEDELEGYRYYLEATGGGGGEPPKPKEPDGLLTRFWRAFGGST